MLKSTLRETTSFILGSFDFANKASVCAFAVCVWMSLIFFSSTTARIALTDARSHSPRMLSAWNESPWSEHRPSKADPGLPTMSWGIFRFFKPSAKSRSCLSPPLQPVSVSICKITGSVSSCLSFLQGILKKSLDRKTLFLRKLF